MQRAEQLQKLSHQHHNGLMAVLLLKKGVEKQADLSAMNDFIVDTWNNELRNHFIKEEVFLHPHVLALPDLMPLYEQMKAEHHTMRKMINDIRSGGSSYEMISSFYSLLEKHIRFEEREMFGYIQEHIQEHELAAAGRAFESLTAKACSDYPVKFWE